jgi:hypothetical protein
MTITQDPSELKFIYNSDTGRITMETYNEGFFNQSLDITEDIMDLAVEKIFDDLSCDNKGQRVLLERLWDKKNKIEKIVGQLV